MSIKYKNLFPIFSFTLKELYDARDPNFIHHDSHTAELQEPELLYCYANTLVFEIKSSNYGKKDKKSGGTNITKYKVFVLFEDFYTIGKDKDIDFTDAVDYAINYADAHIRCTCPAQLYYGYSYMGTQMKYLYGIPRENRFPKIRNPRLEGTICKHDDKVIQWILKNQETVAKLFSVYYNRLEDGQSIYAVNPKGTTVTIGKKNEDGDIFFERQMEEENMAEEELQEYDVEGGLDENGNILTPDEMWEDEDNVTDIADIEEGDEEE